MTAHDLLTAKWKLTPDGWSKLGVEIRRHCYLSHKEGGNNIYCICYVV